jgi:hypothetical protein
VRGERLFKWALVSLANLLPAISLCRFSFTAVVRAERVN